MRSTQSETGRPRDFRIVTSEFEFVGDTEPHISKDETVQGAFDPFSSLKLGLVFLSIALVVGTSASWFLSIPLDQRVLMMNFGLIFVGFATLIFWKR